MKRKVPALLFSAILILAGLAGRELRAEMDFEFGKKLIDGSDPSFNTDDLVEHLIKQLEVNAATKTEAKLLKATFFRKQAATAAVEKKSRLFNDADTLYKEVLAAGKQFKHHAVAEEASRTLITEKAKNMMKAAMDLKDKPDQAAKMRNEAVASMEKISAEHKAAADEAEQKFRPAFKRYTDFQQKDNPNGDKPIPREILEPLIRTFETWVLCDKRWVVSKIEQLECYDDKDAAKKKLGGELGKFCEKRTEDDAIMEHPVIVAWYNFMRGRAYAAILDEANASAAFKSALEADPAELGDGERKDIFKLKKLVLSSYIRMKMNAKKYSDVEGLVQELMLSTEMAVIFDEHLGKELIVLYAKSMTLPDEAEAFAFEKAVKVLRKRIEKEKNKMWVNEFSRAIAEILDMARTRVPAVRPKLSASEWFDAAHGKFVIGQNEYTVYKRDFEQDKDRSAETKREQYEKMFLAYQDAADYYRRTIAEARSEKTPLAERIAIEPKAWFEMSVCFIQIKHYYEAAIASMAMRSTYLPDSRRRWMPDLTKQEHRLYAKKVQDMLVELDKPKEGMVAKAGDMLLQSLNLNAAANASKDDPWNRSLKPTILREKENEGVDSSIKDNDYALGRADMEAAGIETGSVNDKTPPQFAQEAYARALAKYLAACEKFKTIKPASPAYEMSFYQSGISYMLAQGLWATGKVSKPVARPAFFSGMLLYVKKKLDTMPALRGTSQRLARAARVLICRDLAVKAIEALDKYDEIGRKTPGDEDAVARRTKSMGTVLLARNSIASGAENWADVIATSTTYLEWEQKQAQLAQSSADVVLINKFRALVEMASNALAPKCDPLLADAEKSMRELRKKRPKDDKLFIAMLISVSKRYNDASFQAAALMKKGVQTDPPLTQAKIEEYEGKVAELQAERVQMIEDAPGEDPTLEDYSRLLYLFVKTRKDRPAADLAVKLVKKFDPENRNSKIPDEFWKPDEIDKTIKICDEERYWNPFRAKFNEIFYTDHERMSNCKGDHRALLDLLYDTVAPDTKTRPENDKVVVDVEAAQKKLEYIKKKYPDCLSLDPKHGQNGKPLLAIVEEEVDFRRKIQSSRDLAFSLSLKVAADMEGQKRVEEAKVYREMASGQLDILLKIKGATNALLIRKARIDISIAQYVKALESLRQVQAAVDSDSLEYFEATKLVSEVYLLQAKQWVKERDEAADQKQRDEIAEKIKLKLVDAIEYPVFVVLTAGPDSNIVIQSWPDLKPFLLECQSLGAPLSQVVKDKLDGKGAAPKTEPKTEPGKPEQAKPDEPKKEDPAKAAEKPAENSAANPPPPAEAKKE